MVWTSPVEAPDTQPLDAKRACRHPEDLVDPFLESLVLLTPTAP